MYARNTDPDTSHAAAAALDLARLQLLVCSALLRRGAFGATCGELAIMLNFPRDSISPRMRTLEYLGLIMETKRRRKLPRGRPQIVWVATPNNPSGLVVTS